MKSKLATLLFLSLMIFSTNSRANDFGQLDESTQFELEQQRVMELVGSASDTRASINQGRSLAGDTEEEIAWANEFDKLMNDNSDVDYLEKSLEL